MTRIKDLKLDKPILANNKVREVQTFLEENYQIMVNRFDPSKTIIRSLNKVYRHPITINDLSLHLIEEDINHSDTLLRKIISSPNRVAQYDPIKDYFESLKGKYKGVSHIDLLASHIRCREYKGWGNDYFQNRMYKYIKKWIVATAACALEKRPNDVAFGLISSEEGTGKSFFFKFLVPECLKHHLSIPKDDKRFVLSEAFARNFLVLFDELEGIKPNKAEPFKAIMTAEDIDVYLPREPFPVNMPRIASAAFTSNKTPEEGGFITSSMGYRRFLTVELESINQDYSEKIDVDQIWAEALMLFDQNFDYKWNMDDFAEFKEVNKIYNIETPADKYIKMYFKQPINGEGTWMQAQEVLEYLIKNRVIKSDHRSSMNKENIGRALSKLQFKREGKRVGKTTAYRYHVTPM